MKKIAFAAIVAALASFSLCAQDIKLPAPDKNVDMTLMEALQQRHSSRTFSAKEISNPTLSQILWAACGINRPSEKKITAPSAVNAQDIDVYVIRKDGAYLYVPSSNALKKVSGKDLRVSAAGRQGDVASAPLFLLLVSNHNRFGNPEGDTRPGLVDAGYVSQNIALVCTALNLNTVPRMTMDTDALVRELGLDSNQDLVINHPIGYPAK